jgi:hypothetical protein
MIRLAKNHVGPLGKNKLEGSISRAAVLEGTEETVTAEPARTLRRIPR